MIPLQLLITGLLFVHLCPVLCSPVVCFLNWVVVQCLSENLGRRPGSRGGTRWSDQVRKRTESTRHQDTPTDRYGPEMRELFQHNKVVPGRLVPAEQGLLGTTHQLAIESERTSPLFRGWGYWR